MFNINQHLNVFLHDTYIYFFIYVSHTLNTLKQIAMNNMKTDLILKNMMDF
jgi:hypothetical protein